MIVVAAASPVGVTVVRKFERDLAVKPHVPRAVDLRVGTATDDFQQPQMAPVEWKTTMEIREPRQPPEWPQERALLFAGVRFGRVPVDGRAVEDGCGHIGDQLVTGHASSPQPGARAPVAPLCVRRPARLPSTRESSS